MSKKKSSSNSSKGGIAFVTEYTNRWGKRMVASDYGLKAWPIRIGRGK